MEKKETIKIEAKLERKNLTMQVDKEDFAVALKTWRLRQNLTQQQVAERFGVSRWTIIRAEQADNISWPTAYRLFAKLAGELQSEKL